jgi:predicted glycoside hydrolase/deacetylase ChbG (UPF0249 family)
MKTKINADDFGLTRNITDRILECHDNGCLTSVSIIPNGMAFDYAIKEYKKRKNLDIGIHLNLTEGKAISPAEDVYLLVNKSGFFRHSFLSLYFASVFSNAGIKNILRRQVRIECLAQIDKVLKNVRADTYINIDSHMHFHMIPLVFDVLLDIYNEKRKYFRLPIEPFYFHLASINSLKNYLGKNIIKHILLKLLASYNIKKINSNPVLLGCEYFIGVLFTGNTTFASLKKALRKIPDRCYLEILFHPGFVEENEKAVLDGSIKNTHFHLSSNRKIEYGILQSMEFRKLLLERGA